MRSLFAYTHCRVCLFVFYLLGSAQSAYSPSYKYLSAFFHYTMRISMRILANLYNCLTITTNAFAKPREQPRMNTITNECKAITIQPLRFVTELQQYYVILCNTALTPEQISYEWSYKCYLPPIRTDRSVITEHL